jgi:DNA modification methylase
MTSPPYWNLRDYGHEEQLGLEDTSEAYVENIGDVMDAVKRVLRPDGSLWLNLGDTYDDKDLQQIPARVALELQDRGWMLRNRVTWAKPNPMPQSVKDRLNDTTEAVFHFVKNMDYWYDLDAIRENYAKSGLERGVYSGYDRGKEGGKWDNGTQLGNHSDSLASYEKEHTPNPKGKNPGDVFEITTKPFPDAHFATYPPELCEKPLKATCPPKVCVECGAPYEREIELGDMKPSCPQHDPTVSTVQQGDGTATTEYTGRTNSGKREREFKGWSPTCSCDTDATEPGIALDPFAGAGTTLLKAKELGRRFVGIELNPEYADMARARIGLDVHDPSVVRDDEEQNGLEAYQ